MPDHHESLLIQIAGDLKANTASTQAIEKHLDKLNSKVATLESRMQTVEGSVVVANRYIAKQENASKETGTFWTSVAKGLVEKVAWLVIIVVGVAVWQFIIHAVNSAPQAIAK